MQHGVLRHEVDRARRPPQPSRRERGPTERNRDHGFLRRIIITAHDEDGRDFEAIGNSVSRLIAPVPNTHVVSVNSLMDYRINGIQAWGDDQDSWGLGTWAAMRRKQMGLADVRPTPPNSGTEV